jgi:hemolysin activation/secretion protein
VPSAPVNLRNASVYGFYDLGVAFKQDVPGRESAATAGFGFAMQGGRVTSMVELAKPLTHPDVEGSKDLSLFAEIGVSF